MSTEKSHQLEDVLSEQEFISQEISRLVKNCKKDSAERKAKPGYYQARTSILEEKWTAFQTNHEFIKDSKNLDESHEYFKFYEQVAAMVEHHRTYLLEQADIADQTTSKTMEPRTVTIAGSVSGRPTSNDKINALCRRQKAMIASINRTLQHKPVNADIIKSLWAKTQEVYFQIYEEFEDPEESGYNATEYLQAESDVRNALTSNSNSECTDNINLPRISIPKFDGDTLKWTQFFDMFSCMIHETKMPTIRKMWYLKTSVVGEAERLIRHIDLREENYLYAWEILVDAYNNPRDIASRVLNRLLLQQTCSDDVRSLKELHITTIESLASLKGLGIDISTWDPIIIAIIRNKLDGTNKTLYEQSLGNTKEIQPLDTMLQFLEQRVRVMATGKKAPVVSKKEPKNATCATSSSAQKGCLFCKKTSHYLSKCDEFRAKSVSERLNWVQKQRLCVNCFKHDHKTKACTSNFSCFKCNKKHHTLVHLENAITSAAAEPLSQVVASANNQNYNLLATAKVAVQATNGQQASFKALLDSGSQINVVSERLVTMLGLKRHDTTLRIEGIGGQPRVSKARVNVLVKSLHSDFTMRLEAFVLPHIISDQPAQSINTADWDMPSDLPLADPNFNRPGKIDMLIGAEHCFSILLPQQHKMFQSGPMMQKTEFGWIIAGKVNASSKSSAICASATNEETNELMERFWTLDSLDTSEKHRTPIEAHCEKHFLEHLQVAVDGRFIVKLPFSEHCSALGESMEIATKRFISLERRTSADTWKQYAAFMAEYEKLGHMKQVSPKQIPKNHYVIPHHCVLKPDSTTTKLRVVFDASCKTSTGKSLNDILHAGPTVQSDLMSILLRFRTHRYVFTADIEKMYRQVWINPENQFHQLIVWRNSSSEEIKYYRLKTVTYGTKSAPFLAIKCLDHLAKKHMESLQMGAKALQRDFYVDDCLTGTDTIAEAKQVQQELNKILQPSGFKLRKWCSNNAQILEGIPKEDTVNDVQLGETLEPYSVKTLGLIWMPKTDQLGGRTHSSAATVITKRAVCSELAQIFDPLGLFAPVVVKAKIFMQRLWELKLDWDDELPTSLQNEWKEYRDDLQSLNSMQIPRHVYDGKTPIRKELHVFVDASERAYGAAVYVRATYRNKQISVRLLCSKSRVAPTAKQSLPRLELCAALLGAELAERVRRDLGLDSNTVPGYFWSDSTVVLSWINAAAATYHTFVANRIAKIQALTSQTQWRHVSSANNAADVLSRGISARKLHEHNLWLYGPLFLHGSPDKWSALPSISPSNLERKTIHISLAISPSTLGEELYNCRHSHSFHKLQRIVAYMLRFCYKRSKSETVTLSIEELNHARNVILRTIQQVEFAAELKTLQRHNMVEKRSSISSLSPIQGPDGLIRVGGRLDQAPLPYNAKHQILLPYNDPIVKMLLKDLHEDNMHCGAQALRATARQQYWILNDKTMSRNIIHNCVTCNKARPKLMNQIMGNLPADRVTPTRPFLTTGVDYCGPIWIHHKLRGKRPDKAYIAVFCCFSTKAVHLELVSDLTTSAFLGALRRFLSRRGKCQTIHCDNATNFVGANNQLKELESTIFGEKAQAEIINHCNKKQVAFKFIPPRAPSFGGLWEAAVKSAKRLLVTTTNTATLTFEELNTVIVEIEAILNSRPITPMSNDPTDTTALTPAHFLIGETLTAPPDVNADRDEKSLLKRWELVSRIKQGFWKQWSEEYLQELQARHKWKTVNPNIKEGMLVLIKEDNIPVMSWPMGRIIKTYPGLDNHVRVVDVKTASGIYKRAINRLAPIFPEETAKKRPSMEEEDTDKRDTPAAQRRRLTSPTITSSLLVLLLMLPLVLAQSVSVTRFDTKPGVYYEKIGTTMRAISDWTIVIYYELDPYWRDMNTFNSGIKEFQYICPELNNNHTCDAISQHYRHLYDELQMANGLMQHTRKRRSPFDAVGNIANSLFGVLDSDYANKMTKVIKKVQNNEEFLLTLLKNQTSVLDSTINVVKKTRTTSDKRLRLLEQQVAAISQSRGKYTGARLTENYLALTTQLTLLATSLQRMQSEILDVLTGVRHHTISPMLVSPKQLREQLDQIRDHLPPDQMVPVTSSNVIQLYRIMRAEGTATDTHVIFRVILPLVSTSILELFNMVPIPVWNTTSWRLFELKTPIIGVNNHRDQFMGLTQDDLQRCRTLPSEKYICFDHQAVFDVNNRCEFQLFTNKTPTTCQITYRTTKMVWEKTQQPNNWIFATHSAMELQAVCSGIPSTIQLQNSGLLTLSSGCTARNADISISTFGTVTSQIRQGYARFGDIIKPNITKVSETTLDISELNAQNDKELDDLQVKLATLNKEELPNQISSVQHHHIAAYAALAVSVLLLCAYAMRTQRRWTCPPTATRNEAVNPSEPSASPRRFTLDLDDG